jgi:hypothetical protein
MAAETRAVRVMDTGELPIDSKNAWGEDAWSPVPGMGLICEEEAEEEEEETLLVWVLGREDRDSLVKDEVGVEVERLMVLATELDEAVDAEEEAEDEDEARGAREDDADDAGADLVRRGLRETAEDELEAGIAARRVEGMLKIRSLVDETGNLREVRCEKAGAKKEQSKECSRCSRRRCRTARDREDVQGGRQCGVEGDNREAT